VAVPFEPGAWPVQEEPARLPRRTPSELPGSKEALVFAWGANACALPLFRRGTIFGTNLGPASYLVVPMGDLGTLPPTASSSPPVLEPFLFGRRGKADMTLEDSTV
jgi:hypothetical protein